MTQLPDAVGEQSLPAMLLSHVQHEAVIRRGNVSSGVWAAMCASKVLSELLFRPRVPPEISHCGRWRGW